MSIFAVFHERSGIPMSQRLDYYHYAPQTIDAISGVARHLSSVFSNKKLKTLIELRVSQINGCAYCVDMHSHEARELGESQQRIDCVCVWREVTFYSSAERAALAWAEAVTLVAETHVPDDVFHELQSHFTAEEQVQLTAIVGMINLWNRIAIGFRREVAPRTGK